MNKEALMKKVEKLLSLAGNNPSQEEAQAAMAKAQKLIADYNLDMSDMGDKKPEIIMVSCEHANNNGYRVKLGAILAPNFRCKVVMVGKTVAFIGHKTDAEVCRKVFEFAYKTARKGGQKEERRMSKEELVAALEGNNESLIVKMYAFTGMYIGEFKAESTGKGFKVNTVHKGMLSFDITGLQTNCNSRYANRIVRV